MMLDKHRETGQACPANSNAVLAIACWGGDYSGILVGFRLLLRFVIDKLCTIMIWLNQIVFLNVQEL